MTHRRDVNFGVSEEPEKKNENPLRAKKGNRN